MRQRCLEVGGAAGAKVFQESGNKVVPSGTGVALFKRVHPKGHIGSEMGSNCRHSFMKRNTLREYVELRHGQLTDDIITIEEREVDLGWLV